MSAEHRRTAADWHGGQWSALYAYASTGEVLPGLDEEIWDCLDVVERGELDGGLDAVAEHERLWALLYNVEPEVAAGEARLIGRKRAKRAAARWSHDMVGGRASGERAVTARQVLEGIAEGDPAFLDTLPQSHGHATPARLMAACYWPEPDVDDRAAHERWSTAQQQIWDAYSAVFKDEVRKLVVDACSSALAMEGADQGRPFIRAVAGSTDPDSPARRHAIPAGWLVERLAQRDRVQREVVYDPGRYELLVTSVSTGTAGGHLEDAGWEQQASDGDRAVWTRDRVAASRVALDRSNRPNAGIAQAQGIEL